MNWKAFEDYRTQFEKCVKDPCGETTKDDKHFIEYWKTYAAIAIMDVFGREIAKEIADIISVCD